jgi:hypothetical protein
VTPVNQKVMNALNEARMLVLGAQILVGFGYQAAFQQRFDDLPFASKILDAVALVFMVVVVAMLVAPAAFHRIAAGGEDSEEVHAYTSRFATAALLPFALALGITVYVVLGEFAPHGLAVAGGAGIAATALLFWYAIELVRRNGKRPRMPQDRKGSGKQTPLSQRIEQMLTEARVVLPGAQALLGFQLSIVLTEAFENLPGSSKLIHGASLLLIALAIILLMTPAAYHRIVKGGEDDDEFHRFGSAVVMLATIPLSFGIAGDLYVVVAKIAGESAVAIAVAAATWLVFAALWYIYPTLRRRAESGGSDFVKSI